MKWHATNEYPFELSPDDEDADLKKLCYQYFINRMGFDKWAYYNPVKNLSKLLHGDRGYNAGRIPQSYDLSYYPWLDHALYFRSTRGGHTVLVTQPYPHNQSSVTTQGLDMTDLETIKMYDRAFSFYWPENTEIHFITSKASAQHYGIIISEIHKELLLARCRWLTEGVI